MKPKFTIIVPVYNVAPYLRECLDSILLQDFDDLECICVDDGSTDESGSILDEYASKFPRIKAVHQRNAGVSAARNAALEIASGEWLMFLDADDVYLPKSLSLIANQISATPDADMISYRYIRFVNTGDLPSASEDSRDGFQEIDVSREILASQMEGPYLVSTQHVFKRSKCGDVRYENFVCGEDRLYTFDCLQKVDTVIMISPVVYGYRERAKSYTTSVIKTFRGTEGELAYRVAFLSRILNSRKKIHHHGADNWLLQYLTKDYLTSVVTSESLSESEKRMLLIQWKDALPNLFGCKLFSVMQRLSYLLQWRFCSCGVLYWFVMIREKSIGPKSSIRRIYRKLRKHGEYAKL